MVMSKLPGCDEFEWNAAQEIGSAMLRVSLLMCCCVAFCHLFSTSRAAFTLWSSSVRGPSMEGMRGSLFLPITGVKFVYNWGSDGICFLEDPGFSVALLHSKRTYHRNLLYDSETGIYLYHETRHERSLSLGCSQCYWLQLWWLIFSQDKGTNNPISFILLRFWNGHACWHINNSMIQNW